MSEQKQSIAIIGSGITGLSAAWLLHKKYRVTLFEKNDYLGGHTHTHDVQEVDRQLAIDSGFIVYNEKNYPNLVGLFKHLGVKTQNTDMSFAFSLNHGELEYSGSGLMGLFAQKGNLIRLKHWHLIGEIIRFNKAAHATLAQQDVQQWADKSLADFLAQHQFSNDLQQHYLLPMGAAIWSCPVDTMSSFSAYSFLRFFANHGLIDLYNRPQWRTVVGGSREYIRKMMHSISDEMTTVHSAVTEVERHAKGVKVHTETQCFAADQVIFACHADEALALLQQPSQDEQTLLSCFTYQENKAYLHTDERLMPKRSKAWSSWNYLATTENKNSPNHQQHVTATYWMNNLQRFHANQHYFVTLNPYQTLDKDKVIREMTYQHPVFNHQTYQAQAHLQQLQGQQRSWFCGSYTGYGFHEDALSSSVAVCEQLGVIAPWHNQRTVETYGGM